jgi:hypothetical protein
VSGKTATPEVPETHTWLPSDATLHWEVKRKDKEDPTLVYYVKAFQAHHQDFVERIALQEEPKKEGNAFRGFLSLWGGKTSIERSRLSSADPTTVVNSCGEKFQAKRYALELIDCILLHSFSFSLTSRSVLVRVARSPFL